MLDQRARPIDEAGSELRQYLGNPGLYPDPYPLFKRVRDVGPVHWSEAGTWLVLGHPEAREAYKHPGLSTAAATASIAARFETDDETAQEALDVYRSWMLNVDEPAHTRLRGLVAHAFTPKAVRQWEDVIVRTVSTLIESLRDEDEFDFLTEFAYVVPSRVMCDILGVPFEDHKLFEMWTSRWNSVNLSDPKAQQAEPPAVALEEFVAYLRDLIARNRAGGSQGEDLASILIGAREQGDQLTEPELIASIMLLIIAAHDTTANLIDNGMYALLEHPDQYTMLRSDPGLLDGAVEEFLRFDGPARSQPRRAVEDLELAGQAVQAGQLVQIHLGAVNHDGRVFDNPESFDVRRRANKHMGFGYGPHQCLGLHIARLEARHAFHGILYQTGEFELAGEVQWRNAHLRGLTALPVRRR